MSNPTSKHLDPSICGDDGPITPEQCALWLDAQYRRNGDLEDRAAAMWLRKLSAQSVHETGCEPNPCSACLDAHSQIPSYFGIPDGDIADRVSDLVERLEQVWQERDELKETLAHLARGYPVYTNAIGDAGSQYMQRIGGRTSSGLFYWHELWDVLNAAAYSLEHVRQSPQGSVPAIGAPTAPAAPGSSPKTNEPHSGEPS